MNKDYPTDEELEKITKWDWRDKKGLFDFIESIWWSPEWGFVRLRNDQIQLHTGGWSGNEEIIQALGDNDMMWRLSWHMSIRGGHFLFDVKEIPKG